MLYRLSRLIPVHFTTRYGVEEAHGMRVEQARWWQWRGHVFGHHVERVA